jgi:hypothetical protein
VLQHRAGRPHPGARLSLAAALTGILVGAAACQSAATQYDAAEDVRAFITAAREGDRATFERHLDRPAIRIQLLAAVREQAGPLGAVLGEGLVDQLLSPEGLRLALEQAGAPQRTPTAAEIATQLRTLDNGQVCLPRSKDGPCAVTFARSGEVWKLVAIDTSDLKVGG